MIARFSRIHREFGFWTAARTALLVVGLIGFPIFGWLVFESYSPSVIVIAGLIVGWLLRRKFVEVWDWFSWSYSVAAFVYGGLLFLGDRLGISRASQLVFITLVTVLVFNIQFWTLSDPSMVRAEDE